MQWGSLAGALSWPVLAAGQSAAERRSGPETVENRIRPGLEGTGFQAGSLRILPTVAFGVVATDDLYARRVPRVSDIGADFAPAVTVQSQWDRHALTLRADGLLNGMPATVRGHRSLWHRACHPDRHRAGHARQSRCRDRPPDRGARHDRGHAVRGEADRLSPGQPGGSVEQAVGATRLAFDLRFDRFHYFNRQDGATTIVLSQRDYQAVAGGAKIIRPISSAVAVSVALKLNATRYPHENPRRSDPPLAWLCRDGRACLRPGSPGPGHGGAGLSAPALHQPALSHDRRFGL
jgi:hypothetical protein